MLKLQLPAQLSVLSFEENEGMNLLLYHFLGKYFFRFSSIGTLVGLKEGKETIGASCICF